jgi:transcriptional regulator with XRE-family HTH domain
MDTATLVKKIRTDLGLTWEELGEQLGRPPSDISLWECGQAAPSAETVLRLIELRIPQCWRLLRLTENQTN